MWRWQNECVLCPTYSTIVYRKCIHISPLTQYGAFYTYHLHTMQCIVYLLIQCEMCISYSKLVSLTTWNRFLPIFNILKPGAGLLISILSSNVIALLSYFFFLLSLLSKRVSPADFVPYPAHSLFVSLDMSVWVRVCVCTVESMRCAWILCNADRRSNRLVNAEMDCKQRNEMKNNERKAHWSASAKNHKFRWKHVQNEKENGFFSIRRSKLI